jgi:hypothetical protein
METPPPKPQGRITPEDLLGALDGILHPSGTVGTKLFRRAAIGLAAAVLVVALALSSPFVPGRVLCLAPAFVAQHAWDKEVAAHWLDWLSMVSQMALILFIGGAAFTESFARKVADTADKVQAAAVQADQQQDAARQARVRQVYDNLRAAADRGLSAGDRAKHAKAALEWFFSGQGQLSERYIRFGLRGLALNFPGGLYGLLGFLCLLLQVVTVAAKTMLDYAPTACGGA